MKIFRGGSKSVEKSNVGHRTSIRIFIFFFKTELMTWEFLSHCHFVEKIFGTKYNKNQSVKIQPCCNYYSAEWSLPMLVIAAECTA